MYYFTVNYSTMYYSTTTPVVCISETDLRRFTQDFTILLFYYLTISVLYYSTMYYFTVNYSTIYYSTTTPAVCISETDLRRFTQDFTILLFYYFTTILPRPQPFASRKPTCAGSPRILLFYYFTTILPRPQPFASRKPTCAGSPKILLFYYFAILLFQYCTILLCTILLLTIPIFTIPPRPQPFASRKPTCAGSPRILLFYYFSIVRFYYVLFYC